MDRVRSFRGPAQISDQPHIRITLLNRSIVSPGASSLLLFDAALAEATPHLRGAAEATHTILVTNKVLANDRWSNLFYAVRGGFGVISIQGVVDPSNVTDRAFARRYLASMVPLVALHSTALEMGATFLPDRSDATEHGCLHDFGVDRRILIARLRQGPQLCAAEIDGLTKTFGPKITAEYTTILEKSSR